MKTICKITIPQFDRKGDDYFCPKGCPYRTYGNHVRSNTRKKIEKRVVSACLYNLCISTQEVEEETECWDKKCGPNRRVPMYFYMSINKPTSNCPGSKHQDIQLNIVEVDNELV